MIDATENCKEVLRSPAVQAHLNTRNKWWSNYIFHFSHIINIASILNNNKLLSREQLDKLSLSNLNDNASQEVIQGTEDTYKDYVRFYFRPLTPTQYHNEGIRAIQEITELNAHCPVPVFLLFDTALLDEDNTRFSYESLASHYFVELHSGKLALSQAPFNHIYHNESTWNLDGNLIRKRRHAEIVVHKECDLKHLKRIICRNNAEAETLRFLLTEQAIELYESMVCVIGYDNFDTNYPNTIFFNSYLQIISVKLYTSNCVIRFNKDCKYSRNLLIEFLDTNNKLICHYHNPNFQIGPFRQFSVTELNQYLSQRNIVIVRILLDGHLVFQKKFTR